MLSLGSLFDGVGVFPLTASRHGITPLWASEIEKAPISITKRHFPAMAHLGDVTKLHGGEDGDDGDDGDDDRGGSGGGGSSSTPAATSNTPAAPVTTANATDAASKAVTAALDSGADAATAQLKNPGDISLRPAGDGRRSGYAHEAASRQHRRQRG